MSSEEGLRSSVLRVLCYARQLQYVGELSEWNCTPMGCVCYAIYIINGLCVLFISMDCAMLFRSLMGRVMLFRSLMGCVCYLYH